MDERGVAKATVANKPTTNCTGSLVLLFFLFDLSSLRLIFPISANYSSSFLRSFICAQDRYPSNCQSEKCTWALLLVCLECLFRPMQLALLWLDNIRLLTIHPFFHNKYWNELIFFSLKGR